MARCIHQGVRGDHRFVFRESHWQKAKRASQKSPASFDSSTKPREKSLEPMGTCGSRVPIMWGRLGRPFLIAVERVRERKALADAAAMQAPPAGLVCGIGYGGGEIFCTAYNDGWVRGEELEGS